jgi:RNA polymerase sigma-70 factor (ECF subfamily)
MKYSVTVEVEDVGLMQKVKQLESKYSDIIDMIYLKGYTQQEVADLLNIPLGTVKTRVQTALKILRKVLAGILIFISMSIK